MINFYVDLNHLDLMKVNGKDTEKFLQGQLTCDITGMHPQQASRGAACDVKGRVLASFYAWKFGSDEVYLEMAPGVKEIYAPILKKYMVFFKCEAQSGEDDFRRYGVCGEESREILSGLFPSLPERENAIGSHGNNFLLLISDKEPRYEFWVGDSEGTRMVELLDNSLDKAHYKAWEALDIQAGIFDVTPESSGLYTPQLLNYDIAGHVSFKKGCYTGQEIVARMHYRGKPKKRLHRLQIETGRDIAEGALLSPAGQEVGQILKAVPLSTAERHFDALAIVNLSSAGDALSLASDPEAQVTVLPLEYVAEYKPEP